MKRRLVVVVVRIAAVEVVAAGTVCLAGLLLGTVAAAAEAYKPAPPGKNSPAAAPEGLLRMDCWTTWHLPADSVCLVDPSSSVEGLVRSVVRELAHHVYRLVFSLPLQPFDGVTRPRIEIYRS